MKETPRHSKTQFRVLLCPSVAKKRSQQHVQFTLGGHLGSLGHTAFHTALRIELTAFPELIPEDRSEYERSVKVAVPLRYVLVDLLILGEQLRFKTLTH